MRESGWFVAGSEMAARDTLAGLQQSFAEANQKQGAFSVVYQGMNYKHKFVFSNNAE